MFTNMVDRNSKEQVTAIAEPILILANAMVQAGLEMVLALDLPSSIRRETVQFACKLILKMPVQGFQGLSKSEEVAFMEGIFQEVGKEYVDFLNKKVIEERATKAAEGQPQANA